MPKSGFCSLFSLTPTYIGKNFLTAIGREIAMMQIAGF